MNMFTSMYYKQHQATTHQHVT